MVPRYRPVLNPSAWWRWWQADSAGLQERVSGFVSRVQGGMDARPAHLFSSARQALHAYFRGLREAGSGDTVLLSAQLCPVVAHAVSAAGLSIRFVDTDCVYPTPSARQYADAIDGGTAAVVLSPLYGYLQEEWAPLLSRLGRVRLVLDFAQGLLLAEEQDPALLRRADAVVYSFGLGKGLDTGGALLLAAVMPAAGGLRTGSRAVYWGVGLKVVLLRCLLAAGVYGTCLKWVDAGADAAQDAGAFRPCARCLAPSDLPVLWDARLASFRADVERARRRARVVVDRPQVRKACRDTDAFGSPRATHLRQILRLRDASRRPAVLAALRDGGVDCAPAGEPLPADYFTATERCEHPNARCFREDALRLPFLGRLSDAEFERLLFRVEEALA